jgi:hypothetical protein
MYPARFYFAAGGLITYSADEADTSRHLGAQYVGRILKGAKPSDLGPSRPHRSCPQHVPRLAHTAPGVVFWTHGRLCT